MNSRFDDAVPGRNQPDMNSRGVPLIPSRALDQLYVIAYKLSAGRLEGPLADGIREIGIVCASAADFRVMMLMLRNLFLKPSSMDLSFYSRKQRCYPSVWSTQRMFHINLSSKPIRKLATKVILHDALTDDHVTEEDFFLLYTPEAAGAKGSNTGCRRLSHERPVDQDDISATHDPKRVRVRVGWLSIEEIDSKSSESLARLVGFDQLVTRNRRHSSRCNFATILQTPSNFARFSHFISHTLRDAALGAAIGISAIFVAKSRNCSQSRSRSPRKSKSRQSSFSQSSYIGIALPALKSANFRSSFTASSENRKKRRTKKRKGISFFNISSLSSSLDDDLVFGSGNSRRSPKSKKNGKEKDSGDIDSALLGLSATASKVWEDLDSGDQSSSSVHFAPAFGETGRFGSDDSPTRTTAGPESNNRVNRRHEGSILRYVRRSCRPNVTIKTYITNEVEYHFCFVAKEDISANSEITTMWYLHPPLFESTHDLFKQKPSDSAQEVAAICFSNVLANFGGCACEPPANCLLASVDRRRHTAVLPYDAVVAEQESLDREKVE
ncbi:hypothetical protein IFM61392_08670 [Aspergillus lentulus]|nr:hypothetical protein IFM61392_08670 [Aspergillus lentulus]